MTSFHGDFIKHVTYFHFHIYLDQKLPSLTIFVQPAALPGEPHSRPAQSGHRGGRVQGVTDPALGEGAAHHD